MEPNWHRTGTRITISPVNKRFLKPVSHFLEPHQLFWQWERKLAERGGFEPPIPFGYSRFPGVRVKPLCHLSTESGANSVRAARRAQLFSHNVLPRVPPAETIQSPARELERHAALLELYGVNSNPSGARIQVIEGDITKLAVDAIVNAANTTLLGGGGVDGAIHRAAGPELLAECRSLGGCPTGEAKITRGYKLPAKWVIHTVGPVWRDGEHGEPGELASCYYNSLALAAEHGLRSVAFPSISTGAYRFPLDEAARIAVREVVRFLREHELPATVMLVCFGAQSLEAHRRALIELGENCPSQCSRIEPPNHQGRAG